MNLACSLPSRSRATIVGKRTVVIVTDVPLPYVKSEIYCDSPQGIVPFGDLVDFNPKDPTSPGPFCARIRSRELLDPKSPLPQLYIFKPL